MMEMSFVLLRRDPVALQLLQAATKDSDPESLFQLSAREDCPALILVDCEAWEVTQQGLLRLVPRRAKESDPLQAVTLPLALFVGAHESTDPNQRIGFLRR